MPDEYNVWSDGSIETDEMTGVSVAGAEAFSLQSGMAWNTGHWVSLMTLSMETWAKKGVGFSVMSLVPCRGLKFWAFFWLCRPVHQKNVGADNLNVVTHVKCFLANN